MNISRLMRGMLGEMQHADGGLQELKPGQLVRGVVLKTSDLQEVLLRINGMEVMARMQTPMQEGQNAVFQVQPESQPELIVLKPVESGGETATADRFWRDWPKQLGVPERMGALLDLEQELRQSGLEPNRETAQALKTAMEAIPPDTDVKAWLQSAVAVLARGLPMTGQTIAAFRQVLFGQQVHLLLQEMKTRLEEWLSPAAEDEGSAEYMDSATSHGNLSGSPRQSAGISRDPGLTSGATMSAASNAEAHALERTDETGGIRAGADAGLNAGKSTGTNASMSFGAIGGKPSNGIGDMRQGAPSDMSAAANVRKIAGEGRNTAATALQLEASAAGSGKRKGELAALEEQAQSKGAAIGRAAAVRLLHLLAKADNWFGADGPDAEEGERMMEGIREPEPGFRVNESAKGFSEENRQDSLHDFHASDAQSVQSRSGNTGQDRIGSMLKWLGADHERNLRLQMEASLQPPPFTAGNGGGGSLVESGNGNIVRDSVKSLLLSLVSSGDVPPSVKETAQQLIGHITGQQLLLAPERNDALISHAALFVPIPGPDGERTALVHLESRRSRKGRLDSANCRLVFDLSMNTIGKTIVDVWVYDNIVSLQVMNDHPALTRLTDSSREELGVALSEIGYQLLSLRITPLPAFTSEEQNGTAHARPETAARATKSYKGVDYRI